MEINATLIIIALTCVISLVAMYQDGLIEELSMWPYMVRERKQLYRFVTSGLVHADFMHLFFNMFSLYFFGSFTEHLFGVFYESHYVFPAYYALALIVSDIPFYINHRNDPSRSAIGASGAVSACIFTFILVFPWEPMYVYFIKVPAILYGVFYLGFSAYMANRNRHIAGGIGHSAHFWGAAFGVIFPIILQPSLIMNFVNQLLSFGR